MAKASAQKKPNGNDSGLNFEAQLWAAAEQAVPAPQFAVTEFSYARPEGPLQAAKTICTENFRADLHPDLKADFILANPPFNMSDWGGENLRQDVRWKFGMPLLDVFQNAA